MYILSIYESNKEAYSLVGSGLLGSWWVIKGSLLPKRFARTDKQKVFDLIVYTEWDTKWC